MERQNNKKIQQKNELENKVIDIRRVARVVAGGRRFSFRVCIVAGDKKGTVGVGLGKAGDTSLAIEKALRNAKKNSIKIELTKNFSIPRDTEIKTGSSKIIIKSASGGSGLVAGSSVRTVLELAGVKNISAKILSRSKNKVNIARATVMALSKLNK